MGGQSCKTCLHEAKEAINQMLVAGESNRRVATQYGLSEASVRRHQQTHLPAMLVAAAERRELVSGEKITDQVDDLLRELSEIAHSDLSEIVSWGPDGIDLQSSDHLPPELR